MNKLSSKFDDMSKKNNSFQINFGQLTALATT